MEREIKKGKNPTIPTEIEVISFIAEKLLDMHEFKLKKESPPIKRRFFRRKSQQ